MRYDIADSTNASIRISRYCVLRRECKERLGVERNATREDTADHAILPQKVSVPPAFDGWSLRHDWKKEVDPLQHLEPGTSERRIEENVIVVLSKGKHRNAALTIRFAPFTNFKYKSISHIRCARKCHGNVQ